MTPILTNKRLEDIARGVAGPSVEERLAMAVELLNRRIAEGTVIEDDDRGVLTRRMQGDR